MIRQVGLNDDMAAGTPITKYEMNSFSLGKYLRTLHKIIIPPMNPPKEEVTLAPKQDKIRLSSASTKAYQKQQAECKSHSTIKKIRKMNCCFISK